MGFEPLPLNAFQGKGVTNSVCSYDAGSSLTSEVRPLVHKLDYHDNFNMLQLIHAEIYQYFTRSMNIICSLTAVLL